MNFIEKIMSQYDIKYAIYIDFEKNLFAEFGDIKGCSNNDLPRMIFYDIQQVKNIVADHNTIFPRYWSQGTTKATISKCSDTIVGIFFYDDHRDTLEAYDFVQELDLTFKKYVAERFL